MAPSVKIAKIHPIIPLSDIKKKEAGRWVFSNTLKPFIIQSDDIPALDHMSPMGY